MLLLLCKLALAPAFVVLVSLAVRRFGPRVGGVLGGLPVVAGPILFVIALEHGSAFAGEAAANSLAALVALTGFVLTLAWVAGRSATQSPSATVAARGVLAGWVAFCALAAVIATLDVPPVLGLLACAVVFSVALQVLPQPDPSAVASAPARPRHDLALRAAAAAAMVLALTSVAGSLGPAASGVLAPFPIITSVLLGFAVAHETRATTLHLMRGMLRGFFSFATFLFIVAITAEALGTAAAFGLAIAATAVVQLGLAAWLSRGRAVPAAA